MDESFLLIAMTAGIYVLGWLAGYITGTAIQKRKLALVPVKRVTPQDLRPRD